MPVPRLFEASSDPREQWTHVLATLLALGGPETRTALVEEISGEALPDADALVVFERRPLNADITADIVARGAGWTFAVQASLAFDEQAEERIAATFDALNEVYDKCIVIAITPDRRPPEALAALAAGGRDVRHRSWLRVRDWVQERPERGRAEGTDLMLLREAEYFLTPRVAELYRLEGLMPLVEPPLRASLARIFFDMNELAPAPLIQNEEGAARVAFPRTGDPLVEIGVGGGGLTLTVASDGDTGPGYESTGDGRQRLTVASADDYLAGRAWTQSRARSLLPARR